MNVLVTCLESSSRVINDEREWTDEVAVSWLIFDDVTQLVFQAQISTNYKYGWGEKASRQEDSLDKQSKRRRLRRLSRENEI